MPINKDDKSIFRAEAIQYKQEGWFGACRLHIPSSLSLCLFIGLITFSLIILIIIFGSYSERVNISGTVIYDPPAILLIAPNDGVITYLSLFERKKIKHKELIFSVSSDIHTNLGDTNVEMVRLLKKQRNALSKRIEIIVNESKANKNYLIDKINNKEQEIDYLKNFIQNSEEHKLWFEKKSNQYEKFKDEKIIVDSQLIERMKDYYLSKENISSKKIKFIISQGELLDLKNKLSSIDRELDKNRESFIVDITNIEQQILDAEKNKEHLIIAPFDGVITNVTARIGERVLKGQTIGILVPSEATVKIELLSPSDSLGKVANGQRVKMRVAAYPYQWYGKIAGIIESVSVTSINLPSSVLAKGDNLGKGRFRIIVRPELAGQQKSMTLLSGMEVETEIYTKTRKIYQWLFMPTNRVYE